MGKRRWFSDDFKAKIGLEALRCDQALSQIGRGINCTLIRSVRGSVKPWIGLAVCSQVAKAGAPTADMDAKIKNLNVATVTPSIGPRSLRLLNQSTHLRVANSTASKDFHGPDR